MPVTDRDGDTCNQYEGNQNWCGNYDTDVFFSMEMCCACDGGNRPDAAPADDGTESVGEGGVLEEGTWDEGTGESGDDGSTSGGESSWESSDEGSSSGGSSSWESSDEGSSSGSDDVPYIDPEQLDMYELYIEEAYDGITNTTIPINDWVTIEEIKNFVEDNRIE